MMVHVQTHREIMVDIIRTTLKATGDIVSKILEGLNSAADHCQALCCRCHGVVVLAPSWKPAFLLYR